MTSDLFKWAFLLGTGWGIAKNSEFAGMLNHWLSKYDEAGIRDRMWKRWTEKGGEVYWVDDAITLGFENITFPFLFIAEGLAAGAVFLLFEMCIGKKKPDVKGMGQDMWGGTVGKLT